MPSSHSVGLKRVLKPVREPFPLSLSHIDDLDIHSYRVREAVILAII
jgi:uncharacterized protein YlxP (DUF503 family)